MGDKSLVIVESPSKAKTIGKFLGSKYKVVASVGHVRDLPKSKLGIHIEKNFEPEYIAIRGKGDVIKAIRKEAKAADKIYLATDPDREGEAIAWHIASLLGIDIKQTNRIVFNEITKAAIQYAVKHPRLVNEQLVDAQQARRILDRLVGYQISPLLWRKVKRGLSAGRVQSAALKMICDREKEIQVFVPKEFWNITALLRKAGAVKGVREEKKAIFTARLIEAGKKKITVGSKQEADQILSQLKPEAYVVTRVETKERIKKPYPPFTTSSLQQEASNKLGFSTKKTMMIAQQLYEGIDIKGHGTLGLVTYIRTDSVRVSDEAVKAASDYILERYAKEYLGNQQYQNKKKDVQDAHEAIRPSTLTLHPEEIKDSLTKEQYSLYKLIWSRFLASRMTPAVYDSTSADIENNGFTFRANGSRLKFEGYLAVYNSSADDEEEKTLPALETGEKLLFQDLSAEQSFTQPPSRYSEAGLVKELEEKNIGRPSTYAPIIGTLIERRYVQREKKSLLPTDLGFLVNDLMETYFKEIVDAGFTAELEERLDDIEINHLDWRSVVASFYETLAKELEIADAAIEKVKVEDELTDELCELCGKPLAIKHGRFGEFLACSGYPECKNTKPRLQKIDVACPSCGKELIVRRTKKGKPFYGCSGYPACNQVYWNKPVAKHCPRCNSLLLEKKTKNSQLACSNAECGYQE